MKQIIIFLLVIILAIIGYGQYKQYQRFSLKNYEYDISDNLDLNYHNKSVLYKYYEAVEGVNTFIGSQWSANRIDVRNPKDDDAETKIAMETYTKKIAKAKYYEAQLIKSKTLKDRGLTNNDIKLLEDKGITLKDLQKAEVESKIKTMFNNNADLRLGERSAFVYEIQKLLVNKGFDVTVDGVYQSKTHNAILYFEAKNNLFPDGNIDLLTLEALLK
jgi:hypothetical protein